jgi:hypothetical protein
MDEQENFFSQNHNPLLNIAWWAKNIAWIVLVINILLAGARIIQFQNTENYRIIMSNGVPQQLMEILTEDPLKAFQLGINVAAIILRGVVYYLVLKGISLGLNMIVETDINYREKSIEKGAE